jgi:hypothetical protein
MKHITSYDQLKKGKYYLKYSLHCENVYGYKSIQLLLYTDLNTVTIISALSAVSILDFSYSNPIRRKSKYESYFKTVTTMLFDDSELKNNFDSEVLFFELSEDEVNHNIILNEI